jgi:hypothetical protein
MRFGVWGSRFRFFPALVFFNFWVHALVDHLYSVRI